jgi:hypothetical protein
MIVKMAEAGPVVAVGSYAPPNETVAPISPARAVFQLEPNIVVSALSTSVDISSESQNAARAIALMVIAAFLPWRNEMALPS